MKKIIITGGYGFIGSNLIEYLLEKNYFIINIDKLSYSSNKYNLKNISLNKNYIFIKSDIGDRDIIYKTFKKYKPSVIFNLAAETHVDRSIDSPELFIQNNINSVFNLLESIRAYNKIEKRKIKLIHVSTDEVYGDIVNKNLRADESFQYKPSSPYSASKASSDHLIMSYVRTYNLPAIISNCSNNYGPKQFPEKLIPKIIFSVLNSLPIPIYGKGKNSREWIYVKDHCQALEVLSKKGRIGESYNIGSEKNISNITLAKLILLIMKKKYNLITNSKIILVKDRPGHDFRYALNSKKIWKKLNWKSKISFEDGILKTIQWYMQNPNYFKNINKSDYKYRIGLKL